MSGERRGRKRYSTSFLNLGRSDVLKQLFASRRMQQLSG